MKFTFNKLFLASLMALVAQGTVQSAEYSSIFDGEYGNKFNFSLSNKYNDTNNYNDIDNDKYNNGNEYDNYKSGNYYYLKSKLNNNYYDEEDELGKLATDDEDNKYDAYPENNDNDNSFNSVLDDMRENLNNQKARVQYLYGKNARQSNIISDMIRNNHSILLRNDRLNFKNQMLYNNNSILQNDLQRSVIKQEEQKLEIERLKDRVEQLETEKLNNAITVSNPPDDKPAQELPPVPATEEEKTKSVSDNAPAPADNPKVEKNAEPAEVPSEAEEQAKAPADDTEGNPTPAEEKVEFDKDLLSKLQDIIDNKDLSKDTDAFVIVQELLKNIKVIPVKINQEDTNKFIEVWKTYDDKQKPNLDRIFNEMLYNNLPDNIKKNYSDHKIFPLSDAMNFCINKALISDTPFWQEKNKNLLYAYFYWHIASKTEEEQKANEKFNENNIDKEYIELIYKKCHKEFLEPHIKNYYLKKNRAILNNKKIKDNNENGKLINENSISMHLDLNNVTFASLSEKDLDDFYKLLDGAKFLEVLDFTIAGINEVNKETASKKQEEQKDKNNTANSNSNNEKDNKTEINSNQSDKKNNNETKK